MGPYIQRKLDEDVRSALRMGVHQLLHLGTPPHAAVNDTVDVAPRRARGLVNAVPEKVAQSDAVWPSGAVQFSYPDWIWNLFVGAWERGNRESLIAMNTPERPEPRADGYVQGQASQWVVEVIDAAGDNGGNSSTYVRRLEEKLLRWVRIGLQSLPTKSTLRAQECCGK